VQVAQQVSVLGTRQRAHWSQVRGPPGSWTSAGAWRSVSGVIAGGRFAFFFAIRWRQFCTAQQQRRGGRWILTGRRCVARWKPSPGSGSSNSNGQSEMEVG